jgi:hypothetical protein
MVQCHPDLDTAVLEAEDLFDVGQAGQGLGPVDEHVEHRAYPRGWQARERRVMVRGEADDLAPAPGRSH